MKTFRAPFLSDAQLRHLAQKVEEAAGRADPFAELQVLYAEPPKLRAGMLVYADGVTWDPGSGEGIYRRNKTNASWVFVG